MQDEQLPDVTADNLRAMRECRFVTVNRARDAVIALDADRTRIEAAGFKATPYERTKGVWEYEGRSEHPQLVAAVEKHLGSERG